MKPLSILVAGSPNEIQTVGGWLECRGNDVACVGSGTQAAYLLARRHFDLVIADGRLPESGGFNFLGDRRQKGRTARTVVITDAMRSTGESDNESSASPISPDPGARELINESKLLAAIYCALWQPLNYAQ